MQALRQRYRVQSFPTLLFVDSNTGRVIAKDVQANVMNDPNADGFPYLPPIVVAKNFVRKLYTTLVPGFVRKEIRTTLQAHPITNAIGKLLARIPI